MPYLIGTDEAGYGPNLGPLMVTATCWHLPDGMDVESMVDALLPNIVVGEASETSRPARHQTDTQPIRFADSKLLYKSGGSLQSLELPTLAILQSLAGHQMTYESLWSVVIPYSFRALEEEYWWKLAPTQWPFDCTAEQIAEAADRVRDQMALASCRCVRVKTVALLPAQFNRLVDKHGNKANVLSRITLKLVRTMLPACEDEPVTVICDRHGGRTRYQRLLQETFFDSLVLIQNESPSGSHYRWRHHGSSIDCRFKTGAEEFLPVALASMVSKYLRESAMRCFNSFWQSEVPGLKPTAGYPVDARRFRTEIEEARRRLGIRVDQLWRSR